MLSVYDRVLILSWRFFKLINLPPLKIKLIQSPQKWRNDIVVSDPTYTPKKKSKLKNKIQLCKTASFPHKKLMGGNQNKKYDGIMCKVVKSVTV